MSNKGTISYLVDDKIFKSVFTLDNNTVTTINPNDENLLSMKNSMKTISICMVVKCERYGWLTNVSCSYLQSSQFLKTIPC